MGETAAGEGALVFGDLNDPQSKVSRLLSSRPNKLLNPETGIQPRLFFLTQEKR